MSLNESKKRDFVTQLIVIMEQNAELLTSKGYEPRAKIAQLQAEIDATDQAEGRQREAAAAAKNATQVALDTLNVAYADASAAVDSISGCLGKKDNLVIEIKKLRKSPKQAPKQE
jgi:hypothetical protein